MKIHPFIFSNNPRYRLSRHAVFWALWIIYYAVMSAVLMASKWGFLKSFFASLVEVAETTPLDMCFCYFIIYYLFPKFLYKGRYVGMLLLWLLGSLTFILFYYLNAKYVVPHIRGLFGMQMEVGSYKLHSWDFFLLFSQINMEGCVAASIKLGKLWYVKRQEIELIEQEKEKLKPDEDKAIQPAFLTDLLARMEIIANEKPMVAAQSMKKIRRLLLYILYENASSKVPLYKEIELLEQYIDLEKLTAEKEVRVNCSVHGSLSNATIAPFIILPLVENAFKQLSSYSLKDPMLNIIISLQHDVINLKLAWTKPIETSSLTNGRNVILQNISKKLKLIYPESHELKMMIETEKVFIELSINLKKAINRF